MVMVSVQLHTYYVLSLFEIRMCYLKIQTHTGINITVRIAVHVILHHQNHLLGKEYLLCFLVPT